MTTLAEHMIVSGAENRPPMLDKSMYNSWQSRMLLYIKGKKNGRMTLESIENGPLVYPTIEENGVIRPKKYAKLTKQEQLQDDCDVQAINIILQGLPLDVYSLVNHCKAAKEIRDKVNLLMQGTKLSYQERESSPSEYKLYAYLSQHKGHANEARLLRKRYLNPLALVANHQTQTNSSSIHNNSHQLTPLNHTPLSVPQNAYHTPLISQQPQAEFPQIDSGLAVPSFLPGDDPIACLNKAMAFISTVMASRLLFNKFKGDRVRVLLGEGHMAKQCTKPKRPSNYAWFKEKMLFVQAQESGQVLDEEKLAFLADLRVADVQVTQTTIQLNVAFQTYDLDAYDSDYDDISLAKGVLMANLSSYGSAVFSEVTQHDTYQNDNMLNQSVQETQNFEQSLIDYVPDNEITSDSNIISYEQYLQETQNAIVQDTNSSAQQDAMIMSVFEQMSNQVTNCNKIDLENKLVNESLTAELERYKEHVKTFEERLNVDLISREIVIDSQIDDMIRNRNALKQEIDSLKQTLSKQIKEKESLL
ncbi:hypothetical protein Tco_1027777 [Tanacetum coccineum]